MEGSPFEKSSIARTISDQMEEVAKEALNPAKGTSIGRSCSEQLGEATKEMVVTRKSSVATIGRTVSDTDHVMTPSAKKPPLGRKMQSPRVSGHIPKWKSAQFRIEDELTNSFFEEVALSRASSATSHGLSFSIAGPVMAPTGDMGLINDLQEARLHASMALNKTEVGSKDIEKAIYVDGELQARDPPLPIFLKFVDVKYKVILKGRPTNILRNAWTESIFIEKEILHGVTGSVVPGEVLAMMGPSGSGKTTLINLLGGRMQQNVLGSITYNDQPYTKALKRRIGFVMQDDVLFPHLTVRETLTYAALLRLPNTLTKHQKEQRAQEVICELGLERCQDTIIGGAFVRGLSGGERKRVCIGNEILIDPSLLFLDEPTSGLDSTTALRIVQMLHDIAEAGRTVVTTIHQPSSRLFHKFDKLILLGEGHSIYFGKASNAMDYFSSIGCAPLITMNPADFLLDLANANFQEVSIPPELQDKVQIEAVQAEIEGDLIPSGRPSPHDLLETGLVFFIAVFWGFFPVFTAIFTFPQERAMLAKERAVDMYRLSAYFTARTLSDLPLDLFLPVVYLLIVYFMAHLRMTAAAFFLTLLTVFLSIVASQGLGLAIGAAFMNLKKATTLASVTMLTFMLAGGFFVQQVPVFIEWIRYLSFNYYTYRILVKIQYDPDQHYDCSSSSGCKSIATSPYLRGIPLDGGWKEGVIMIVMVFGYRLLAYILLRRMKLKI